ncbi:plasmid pRiA4b ORF-3 family protein, partial [Sinorhizobium medicae]
DYDPAAIDAANLRNNVDALATKWKRRSRKKA